jgi:2-polyprenyl-3-methyl-5-hydroxy-6-metoxy-1,4-benzoquinol methylase
MVSISGGIGVIHCGVCRSSFLDFHENSGGDTGGSGFDEYWDQVNQRIYSSDPVIRELETKYKKYYGMVKDCEPNVKLLDVGCGFGISVNSARESGFDAEGIEPSRSAVEYATGRFGINVTHGLLDKNTFSTRFGVISSWDVIEHVLDPEDFARNCAAHLEPGGFLILETPEESAPVRRLVNLLAKNSMGALDYRSKMYYKEHRFYFSREGMRRLLERNGFRDVRFFKEGSMIEKEILKNKLYNQASGLKLLLIRSIFTIIKSVPAASNKMIVIAEKNHAT